MEDSKQTEWRVIGETVPGASHLRADIPNQDSILYIRESSRSLPILLSVGDGQDDFEGGLKALMEQPWGKKAVRIAISIGQDADPEVLQKFIGNSELKPLAANSPEALVKHIKWASTAVLKSASSPAAGAEVPAGTDTANVPIPIPTAAPATTGTATSTGAPNTAAQPGTPAGAQGDPNDQNTIDDVW